ncbi:SusD-like starch-binding protein associating with outer membrane [Dysgonomonas alginatilytica]|uniref:SusD-like starch-binding protein associating with outer membrane n=1 Tax=Dysgonomonas alginatilytica TaxID=1605892 RepID=A0A2V3PT49_9BACT|nr:RagB/SusD family nutrient uptake outer membrane protein [Dysgonomonas alginatilytica]PXV66252.1 SusD-like starch-binding protein associating with outer membrane [Dysgonomonas alginatilytica]
MKRISIIFFNTKKTFIMSSAIALLLAMPSCKDWLDMPSYNASDTETVFSDETTADMYVQGCYRGLIHQEMYYQLGMGETVVHSSEDGSTNNSKYNVCNYFYDTTSPYTVTTIYKEQYRVIESTNIAISQLNKMPETDKRNALLGEALAIRAFCYYNLIRIYGDVPAVWTPLEEMDPNDDNTFYPKRSPRDVIYDQIVSDLQTAVNYIPWYSEGGNPTYERLTKQGAYGLLARVALYAGGYSLRWNLETNDASSMKMGRRSDEARVRELYQIASDACQAVVSKGENSLIQNKNGMSGFQHLWYNFCQRNFAETTPEILWELAQYGENTNSNFGVLAQPGSRGGVFGSRKAMQFMLPTYYLSFDRKDTRRDVSCTAYSIYFLNAGAASDTYVDVGTTLSCIMPGKFRISWCTEPQEAAKRNLNIPVLRYSDVLLMYAEAQNYLNNSPTQAAKDALQKVRDRAGIGSMPVPSDMQGFEDAIVQERKWEFAGEFNLRTDLIRMNRLAKELAATKQDMKNLSDRAGKYANTPVYRLYKFQKDAQKYGDKFLALEYIDLTDAAEIAIIKDVPTDAAEYDAFQRKVADMVKAHGITIENGDKWYPANMFQAYTSSYNGNARKAVGFAAGFNALQIGNIIYTKPTGSAENGGNYPNWIEAPDGSDGLYYGFKENCVELLPFAAKAAGHPMIDNPNLTQHPGYK